jgi:septal ring factor EnvC (AmiA/AmiB activator)
MDKKQKEQTLDTLRTKIKTLELSIEAEKDKRAECERKIRESRKAIDAAKDEMLALHTG